MADIPEITAQSWSHLMELLYEDSWDPTIERFRSSFAFRGVSENAWALETSLMRLGGPIDLLEKHLLRNFRKYAHSHIVDRDSLWYWLTFAQHHGLPTRLLDWTYSPYVALHFATDNVAYFKKDGAVWMTNIPGVHKELPGILADAMQQEGSFVFTTEMLTRFEQPELQASGGFFDVGASNRVGGPKTIRTLEDFDNLANKVFLIFLEPPSIDERIINQFALFSVLSNPKKPIDSFLKKHTQYVRKVVIPAALKQEIRDKLDQANITERVLFPGLDGLSNWLKRHYSRYPSS
jgi:hypothetical protein